MERETERLREVIRDLKFAFCGIHAPERRNLSYAISVLESIEDAEFGTWIPCDVIMPETGKDVLISTIDFSNVERYVTCAHRCENGRGWIDVMGQDYANNEIKAWMPEPKPYERKPNGKWIERRYGFECSKCGANIEGNWNQEKDCMMPFDYCPCCGNRNEVSECQEKKQ